MRIASWNDEQPTTLYQRAVLAVSRPMKGPVEPEATVDIGLARGTPNAPTDTPPRQLGPYLMYERLGRGSISSVHLGSGPVAGVRRAVVIKLLDPQAACHPLTLAMLFDEARLGSRVNHRNVVRTVDLATDPDQGTIGLVTEYIYGETLARLARRSFRRHALSLEVAAGVLVAMLRGLQAVHEATSPEGTPLRIVHRDISPQNVMVGVDGEVRLIDFGIATSAIQTRGREDGRIRGKPRYMAPEHIRNKPLDQRADVFGAGVVAWELVTGHRLFEGEDTRLIWSQILNGHPPPPSRLNPAIPRALDAVILQALRRNREHRFPTASAFADALGNATAIAQPNAIAAWVQAAGGDLLARQIERVEEIVEGHGHRPERIRRPTPVARRVGQVAGVGLLGVVLLGAAARNKVSVLGVVEQARARAPHPALAIAGTRSLILPPVPPLVAAAPVPVTGPPVLVTGPPVPVTSAPVPVTGPPGPVTGPPGPVTSAPVPAPVAIAVAPAAKAAVATVPPPPPVENTQTAAPTIELLPALAPASFGPERRQPPEPRSVARPSFDAGARPTPASRPQVLSRIADLNRRAETAYRSGDFGEASRLLHDALTAAATAKLASDPQTALAHARLAAVLIKGYRQEEEAVKEFRLALLVPRFSPSPSLLDHPRIVRVYEQAVASLQPDD